jgi:hypothetical protein
VAQFDGGTISSDREAFLLRETDRRLKLLPRLAECFLDGRNQKPIEYPVAEMPAQRIYGLALGYEDIKDHEQLRKDPIFGILSGRAEPDEPLAGKSALNRMELGTGINGRYKITCRKEAIDELLVNIFMEAQPSAPAEIVLDVDTTDLPLHGKQEGRFFHGYYDEYCYLLLYVFRGEACAVRAIERSRSRCFFRLSGGDPAHRDADSRGMAGRKNRAARGFRFLPQRVDELVREQRSGFRLRSGAQSKAAPDHRTADARSHAAVEPDGQTGANLYGVRLPDKKEDEQGRRSGNAALWPKAEHIDGKENPRFVVTSPAGRDGEAGRLYEELYCARGDMENRIKEQFSLFADRVSTETMRANQLRLYLSAMAYILMNALRRLGLHATELAQAQVSTIRAKLLRIGAQIRITVRKVGFQWPPAIPGRGLIGRSG